MLGREVHPIHHRKFAFRSRAKKSTRSKLFYDSFKATTGVQATAVIIRENRGPECPTFFGQSNGKLTATKYPRAPLTNATWAAV